MVVCVCVFGALHYINSYIMCDDHTVCVQREDEGDDAAVHFVSASSNELFRDYFGCVVMGSEGWSEGWWRRSLAIAIAREHIQICGS